jgi:hypothetical protein
MWMCLDFRGNDKTHAPIEFVGVLIWKFRSGDMLLNHCFMHMCVLGCYGIQCENVIKFDGISITMEICY